MEIKNSEKTKILVVDDNESICDLLDSMLSDEGYLVSVVYRGDTAMEMLQQGSYNLVLLDLMLPGLHGIEILRGMREACLATDAVMMTSTASLETAVEALRLGAQDYLLKPFENLDMVLHVVEKTLEKRRLIVENEQLHRSLQKRAKWLERTVERLTSINEMSLAMNSILNLDKMLNFIVEAVTQKLQAERVSLMLHNLDTGRFEIRASVGIDAELAPGFHFLTGDGIAGHVIREGHPLLVEDIDLDPRFEKQWQRGYLTDSFLSVPLIVDIPISEKPEVIGVINVNNKAGGGSFSEEDLNIVAELAKQSALAIGKLHAVNRELKDTQAQTIMALAEAVDAKDTITGCHGERIPHYASKIAKYLGFSSLQTEDLINASLLHDIGKIGISELILNKPTSLSDEEFVLMKDHPIIGANMIKGVKFLESVAPIILAHHEKYDGSGYPAGLKGEEIPLLARVIAVLDSFDAMTSDRPYRVGQSMEWAFNVLKSNAGTQFDPQIVEAFIEACSQEDMWQESTSTLSCVEHLFIKLSDQGTNTTK